MRCPVESFVGEATACARNSRMIGPMGCCEHRTGPDHNDEGAVENG